MMALVLGGLSFVLYNKMNKGNEQENAQQEVFTRQDAYNFMNDVGQKLSEKQLAFDMVDSLYEVYENHEDTIKKYVSKDICDYLCGYKKATDFVRKGDIASIEKVVDPQNKYKLYHTHLDVLKLIVKTNDNKKIFSSMFSKLKCFDDIADCYNDNTVSANTASMDSIPNNIDDKNKEPHRQYKCSQCNLWFKTREELTNHQEYACKENKFVCRECSLRFKNKNKLQQHKNKTHTTQRGTPFKKSNEYSLTEMEFL